MSAATAANGGRVRLDLGGVDELRVSVAMLPHISVLAIVCDAVAGIHRGLPNAFSAQVNSSMPTMARRALSTLGAAPCAGWVPDCVSDLGDGRDIDAATAIARMRETDSASIRSNLAREFGDQLTDGWQDAMQRPQAWISACADGLGQAARTSEPLWGRARALFDREVDRVGNAVVRHSLAGLFTSLNSRLRYQDNTLSFSHAIPGSYSLNGREIVLLPMLVGDRMLVTHLDDADRVWIGYPLPGLGQIWTGGTPQPAGADPLARLLGTMRAAVLRELNRPSTMGCLAVSTGCAPSRLTAHCDRLEAAGLIQRDRRGRAVVTRRTEVGDQLIDLYAR